ncbi:dihydrofolate reductase [Arundinibacter roseus]|uniref:Dihydrofolate reductase n=1 Tax=Arundinibacter roseus TaxID=2070510 RepID=A0A4R4K8Y2_9BACT|nr:dihydrofolate reductase [Arundinibacter roseus]TDB64138.1 dihydrofolate reductase [Arundinibacter roseus]
MAFSIPPPATVSIIVAMSENRCIGQNNHLPWRLPDEWAYFKQVTDGAPFLMGRRSYESPDGLYSSYRNVVLSKRKSLKLTGPTEQAQSLDEAFDLLANEKEIFVLGGVAVFEELLPHVQKLYLSIVHTVIEGDVYFPEINWEDWQLTQHIFHEADAEHSYAFSMNQYVRRKK